jgi:plasmid stability protein
MPNVMVRNIPERDYAELQQDAKQNRRSINAEILSLLADKAAMNRRRRRMKRAIRKLDRLREEVSKKYPANYEMLELIREEREGRQRP